jgi:hypothetical protein
MRLDAVHVEVAAQQLAQRRVVEQAARAAARPARDGPAQAEHGEPARAALHRLEGIGTVDVLDMQALPEVQQAVDGTVEIVRMAGQRRRIDGPGRGAADDRKGVGRHAGIAAQLGDGRQHPDLIGRTRAAARQDQSRDGVGADEPREGPGHGLQHQGPVGATAMGLPEGLRPSSPRAALQMLAGWQPGSALRLARGLSDLNATRCRSANRPLEIIADAALHPAS